MIVIVVVRAEDWQRHLGDVGEEPPLPTTFPTYTSLTHEDKKATSLYVLALIPEKVNGQKLSLDCLKQLVEKPKLTDDKATTLQYEVTGEVQRCYGKSVIPTLCCLFLSFILFSFNV